MNKMSSNLERAGEAAIVAAFCAFSIATAAALCGFIDVTTFARTGAAVIVMALIGLGLNLLADIVA